MKSNLDVIEHSLGAESLFTGGLTDTKRHSLLRAFLGRAIDGREVVRVRCPHLAFLHGTGSTQPASLADMWSSTRNVILTGGRMISTSGKQFRDLGSKALVSILECRHPLGVVADLFGRASGLRET